jgi:hypothetical protein
MLHVVAPNEIIMSYIHIGVTRKWDIKKLMEMHYCYYSIENRKQKPFSH